MKNEDNNQTDGISIENNISDTIAEDDASGGVVGSDYEEVSESEENEKTVVFTCKGDGITVTAETKPENGIPESAVLHADKLVEGSEEYNEAMEKAREGLELKEDESFYYDPYDIYFIDGDERIEPKAGKVKVRMMFEKKPFVGVALSDNANDSKKDTEENLKNTTSEKIVMHILGDGEVENINPKILSSTSVEFEINRFSVMGIAMYETMNFTSSDILNGTGITYIDLCNRSASDTCNFLIEFYYIESPYYNHRPERPDASSAVPCTYNGTIKKYDFLGGNNHDHLQGPLEVNGNSFNIILNSHQGITLEVPYILRKSIGGSKNYTMLYKVTDTTHNIIMGPKGIDFLTAAYNNLGVIQCYFHSDSITPTPSPTPSPTPIPEDTGSLKLIKTVTGSGGDQSKDWNFTITLSGAKATNFNKECTASSSGGASYNKVTFSNSTAHVSLKHNQSITIQGLPTGASYTVTETEENQDRYKTTKTGDTGTITKNVTAEAKFTNNKDAGLLKISNTVTGAGSDLSKEWKFNIALSGDKANEFNGTCEVEDNGTVSYTEDSVTFTSGSASVLLKGGQSITIKGIPTAFTYKVTEEGANQDGYTTTSSGESGQISEAPAPEAAFTNSKAQSSTLPSTGGSGTRNLALISLFLFALGLTVAKALYTNKKHTNH